MSYTYSPPAVDVVEFDCDCGFDKPDFVAMEEGGASGVGCGISSCTRNAQELDWLRKKADFCGHTLKIVLK